MKKKLIKPSQFAENEIIKAIISNEWPTDYNLPSERELAGLLGLTRPTLREVLQRLSRDGWITIQHGKSTTVNDYKKTGGLGVLKTLINFKGLSSKELIKDWLEFRIMILPSLASEAIKSNPELIVEKLNQAPSIRTKGVEFAAFDWEIQILMMKLSGNMIAQMLYNDLSEIYQNEGTLYFRNKEAKMNSVNYYEKLHDAIINNKDIKKIVKNSMKESCEIWKKLNK